MPHLPEISLYNTNWRKWIAPGVPRNNWIAFPMPVYHKASIHCACELQMDWIITHRIPFWNLMYFPLVQYRLVVSDLLCPHHCCLIRYLLPDETAPANQTSAPYESPGSSTLAFDERATPEWNRRKRCWDLHSDFIYHPQERLILKLKEMVDVSVPGIHRKDWSPFIRR